MEIISEKANGKHTVFAKHAGIPTSTFQGYINGRPPHAEHLIRIREKFFVNIDWLLTGKGKKYIDDDESDTSIYKVGDAEADPEIAELIAMTRAVLKAGTDHTDTLITDIRSSHRNLMKNKDLNNLKERVAALEKIAHPPNNISKLIRKGDDKAQRGEILKKRKA